MAKVNLFDSNSESYFGDQFRKEAWENALEIEPTIDRCTEYENAYVFSYPECRNTIGPMPIVIMKDDLAVVSMLDAVDEGMLGEELDVYEKGAEEKPRPQGLQMPPKED